jgi:uncharacterized membrane protein
MHSKFWTLNIYFLTISIGAILYSSSVIATGYSAIRLDTGESPWIEQPQLNYSWPSDLNNNGQVVGNSGLVLNGVGRSALGNHWQSNSATPTTLDSFADPVLNYAYSPERSPAQAYPYAINDSGQIVGVANGVKSYQSSNIYELNSQAAIWQQGSTTPERLGTQTDDRYIPKVINNNGQIAGVFAQRPVFWESYDSEPVYLDNPSVYSSDVSGMNSNGQVVGYAVPIAGTGELYGAVWQYGSNTRLLLPFVGGVGAMGYAINDNGLVVGVADNSPTTHSRAALWLPNSDRPVDLGGGDGSFAYGVNADGQVVGSMMLDDGSRAAAFWLAGSSSPIDLNTLIALQSGDFLTYAYGINDSGQIIAVTSNDNGTGFHAYLLTPVSVPLPTSGAVFIIGLFNLFSISNKKRSMTIIQSERV